VKSKSHPLRIALAQIDPVVGAFGSNIAQIVRFYERACALQARFLLTPELSICGYPPHDLLDRADIVARCEQALHELAALTLGKSCALIVGHVARNPKATGRAIQNVVSVLQDGKEVFRQAKSLLPTYDVFDEARYFEPAQEISLWDCDGVPVGIAICEDLWGADSAHGRQIYGRSPVDEFERLGAKLILSSSASPYEQGKRERREELHSDIARKLRAPLIYINQVGATDEVLFDGASFAVSSDGALLGRLPAFRNAFGCVEWDPAQSGQKALHWVEPGSLEREDVAPQEIEVLRRALVCGIRDYFERTGFKKAVLGLSGGIDSAVIAVLAVEALGRENLLTVAMPSQYSSGHSLEDAEILARNLGVELRVKPIKFLFTAALRDFSDGVGDLAPVAQENLQSRLRALNLLALSNHEGSLILTTGNKSELATGYCTLYGDMCGALAPIGDVLKTQVYDLARHLNQVHSGLIPARILEKPPSAELRPDQRDQDTLPPYPDLDELLRAYLEEGQTLAQLEERMGSRHPRAASGRSWVREVVRKLEINEFKRRQAAPVLKVSSKAFGIGRRIPIAKTWDV
jgi:NAD+ synthase (glutamine-hydrolysing)